MNVETLISVLATLLVIASAVERLIEIAKPLTVKIVDPNVQASVKISAAMLVGFGLAALFDFDVLVKLGIVGVAPVVGFLAAGVVSSVGSSVLHPLLEWLKGLKNPVLEKAVTFDRSGRLESSVVTSQVKE